MNYVLAIDIGASSGRHILGYIKNDKLEIKEIHRFENSTIKKGNHLVWQVDALFEEIKEGIRKCHEKNIYPESVALDTWGVDYVLLDENDELLGDAISYRDSRTENIVDDVMKVVSKEKIYSSTGIQQMHINTLFQLAAQKKEDKKMLDRAKTFLTMPDYLGYLLSGAKYNEYTEASTTQLLDAKKKNWDRELILSLSINPDMFIDVTFPGSVVGTIKKDIAQNNMKLITVGSHDTASAVAAIPVESDDFIYISSGTWALMGVEANTPNLSDKTMNANFTNEGGVYDTITLLKNITGMWIIQEVRRVSGNKIGFGEYVTLASEHKPFVSLIDLNDIRFHSPQNMVEAIQSYCKQTNQEVPKSDGAIARCIFDSMAMMYKKSLVELEDICKKQFSDIHIIGGGCQNVLVNQLTADVTEKNVISGPIEATAIGNILVQLITLGEIDNIESGRNMVSESFSRIKYYPQAKDVDYSAEYEKFLTLI